MIYYIIIYFFVGFTIAAISKITRFIEKDFDEMEPLAIFLLWPLIIFSWIIFKIMTVLNYFLNKILDKLENMREKFHGS